MMYEVLFLKKINDEKCVYLSINIVQNFAECANMHIIK